MLRIEVRVRIKSRGMIFIRFGMVIIFGWREEDVGGEKYGRVFFIYIFVNILYG